jgi:GNAT superfamily N-acetyltransferase
LLTLRKRVTLITLALATAADVDDFVALATEMDVFYGDVRPDPPQQRAAEISAVLFGVPPAAFALLARDDTDKLVGFAAYSFLWPAVGLSMSLYLKELYVADTARRTGVATALMRACTRSLPNTGAAGSSGRRTKVTSRRKRSTRHSGRSRCRRRSSTAPREMSSAVERAGMNVVGDRTTLPRLRGPGMAGPARPGTGA